MSSKKSNMNVNVAKNGNAEKSVHADSAPSTSNISITPFPVPQTRGVSLEDYLDRPEEVIRHTQLLENEKEEWMNLYKERKERHMEAKKARREGKCVFGTRAECLLTDEELEFCASAPDYKSMVKQCIKLDKQATLAEYEVATLEEFVLSSLRAIEFFQEAKKEDIMNKGVPDKEDSKP